MGAALHEMVREGRSFSGHEQNCCFLNLGDGKFADVSANTGFDFPDDGRALAQTDWDGDGDLDLWIANRSGPQIRFLRNDLQTSNHFLAVRLRGEDCNRDAIGARVEVVLDDEKQTRLVKTLRAGEGFLAQSSKELLFGLGGAESVNDVLVVWPGGERESFGKLKSDQRYQLVEHSGEAKVWSPPARKLDLGPGEVAAAKSPGLARVVSTAQLPVPPLDYTSFGGEQHRIGEGNNADKSKKRLPLLINLWASWCRACIPELREFGKHSEELKAAGVEVVVLSVDRLDQEKGKQVGNAEAMLAKLGYQGTAGWATSETVEMLELVHEHLFDLHVPLSLPTSLLLDENGELAVIYRGPVDVAQLIADVETLNASDSELQLPFPGRWHTHNRRISPLDLAWKLVERGHLDQSIEYIDENRPLLENHFNAPKLLTLVGNAELGRGNARQAQTYYQQALELDVNYGEAQNNLAWTLATHPDEALRNGPEAIRLATAALQSRRGNILSMLDTLSAAYAENGQFEQAVKVARKAIEIAQHTGQTTQANKIQGRLLKYEASQPYRSP